MSTQAQCSHSKVNFTPIDWPGGTRSDRWTCPDCGTSFWPETHDFHGMKLRDWFAGMALQSDTGEQGEWPNNEVHARWAYSMADAMIAERSRTP